MIAISGGNGALGLVMGLWLLRTARDLEGGTGVTGGASRGVDWWASRGCGRTEANGGGMKEDRSRVDLTLVNQVKRVLRPA